MLRGVESLSDNLDFKSSISDWKSSIFCGVTLVRWDWSTGICPLGLVHFAERIKLEPRFLDPMEQVGGHHDEEEHSHDLHQLDRALTMSIVVEH